MDASLRWHDEEEAEDASLRPLLRIRAPAALVHPEHRPLLRIRAPAALVHPEHRWHDEEMAEVVFIGVESWVS